MNGLSLRVKRVNDGTYRGEVSIGGVTVGAESDTAAQSLNAAVGLGRTLITVLDQHPEMRALMPPQAQAALKAIQLASWAAKNGELRKYAKQIPNAAKTVANVLRGIL
jgi:hypothetical protein